MLLQLLLDITARHVSANGTARSEHLRHPTSFVPYSFPTLLLLLLLLLLLPTRLKGAAGQRRKRWQSPFPHLLY
jgi:hypothetical protein